VLETVTQHEHITFHGDPAPSGLGRASRLMKGNDMTRVSLFSSPLLLGFGDVERLLERVSKSSGDGYPPYNIERFPRQDGEGEHLRITLALAGFSREELEVTLEENQLIIRGRQKDDEERSYLHRGIAARQFQRAFVLADGMEVKGANLENGLLTLDLERPEPERVIRRIEIKGA
jgi:HSP20 family molecular chaperone IbpA